MAHNIEFGYFLSSEEQDGTTLLETAHLAEEHGFDRVWISDHYHPWIDRQGNSPFVWSVIGALAATTNLRVSTAVTCPGYRIHPAIVAQAAATCAAMMPGRFTLGVGTGENLNEHILGDRWPMAGERLERLAESIEVMRELWRGEQVNWHGKYYTVEGARIYTRPDEPIPIHVSAFGPRSLELVLSHGDGLITTMPDADFVREFRDKGRGKAVAGAKVCWGSDEAQARRTVLELWPHTFVPGELAQELRMPAQFEQVSSTVTEEQVGEAMACGPDPDRHLEALAPYIEAGFDELHISQIGPDQAGFMRFFRDELRPRLEQ